MDLIIATLIFLVGAAVVISLLTGQQREDASSLRVESEVIATRLVQETALDVAPDNQLNMAVLYALASASATDYDAARDDLGAQSEFCIYLQDEEGNIVFIRDPENPTQAYAGVGSGSGEVNLTAQGIPCGVPCTILADGTCSTSSSS